MKSAKLLTTPILIVTNYTITPDNSGKFLHKFTPENTTTVYQFLGNKEPILEKGERYNIGYEVISGINWVDVSAIAKADEVNPTVSHYLARSLGEQIRRAETGKSDARVTHNARDGHYLGKKYAWRIYGMAVARDTFDDYLDAINHPKVQCYTDGSPSVAYKDIGIDIAMDSLIKSCAKVGKSGNRFSSPLLPNKKWFQVKGLTAITPKK